MKVLIQIILKTMKLKTQKPNCIGLILLKKSNHENRISLFFKLFTSLRADYFVCICRYYVWWDKKNRIYFRFCVWWCDGIYMFLYPNHSHGRFRHFRFLLIFLMWFLEFFYPNFVVVQFYFHIEYQRKNWNVDFRLMYKSLKKLMILFSG